MPLEMHIASVVVQAVPRLLDDVVAAVARMPAARLHGRADSGKLVVTLDGASAGEIVDQVGELQQLPGVINVALVYQHIEPLDPADEASARAPAAPVNEKEGFPHEHTS
ncbi:chaperone NapD [Mitsuaria sp. GD03876]|uniref:chaperone NapD n=1 Tax=Mitsuaria sp. GD03876 TaxID=2975399 RepID=UPI0024483C6F|nr:chaperone NapD [Mitsuaria sp. GD03876]MDH0868381.1 chaperone NapD [Mitsuaria sp. GD03876]